MTKAGTERTLKNEAVKGICSILMLGAVLFFGLALSDEVTEYVKEGMRLAIECVIPSSFPFMIISDMYVSYGRPENIRPLKACFTALFGLPPEGLAAFISGNIFGFPIGAKMVADSYSSGALSKDEAQRLLPLCNNPSCAFIVGGVGLGIYGDWEIGIMLVASVYLSTVVTGLLIRKNKKNSNFTGNNIRQNYIFVDSVKRAALSSVSIISFISLFSAINGIIKKRVNHALISYIISAFLEVTNAVKSFSSLASFSPILALSLSAFSLGFGGISVGMQSSVFTSSCGLGMKKYYIIKLLQGIIAAAVFSLIYLIKNSCGAI